VRRRDLLAAAAAGLASGCGYALQGRGITTDPSIRRIGVPLFKDRTGKIGLDQRVTQAVMEELLKRGRFTVVRDTTGVDAVVEGEVVAWNALPVNYSSDTGTTQATRYTISLTASVVYRKVGQKEPLWANEAFSQRDEYDMGENPQTYFDREEQSMERLSAAFARNLVAAMLEAF
jgi:outer membrane lipopolysaccharide assembly protein LptE/RlpB